MKMTKLLVSVPESLKAQLDALRTQGYTASGFIRALLERELNAVSATRQKGR
jgi:mannitol/fructose-specific phosphotransferase system IIA component